MAGFRKKYQDHRRLSEQLLQSQAILKMEQASCKLLEGFSQLVSDFIEASRNFSWDLFSSQIYIKKF
jgi:hypothetical protein